MSLLYITADQVGNGTGGGTVTFHESEALKSLGSCQVWGRKQLAQVCSLPEQEDGPWQWDEYGSSWLLENAVNGLQPSLAIDGYSGPAHFYAGTFTKTIRRLKELGIKVTYTAAAHDIDLSRREHRRMGIPFNYPHLVDPKLWERYVGGYLAADVLICPSYHSGLTMQKYGFKGRLEVIPHGVDLPERIGAFPSRFTVGYMGAIAPDKGLIYLLQAWRKLNYKDAHLIIAGRESASPFMYSLLEKWGGGNVMLAGWQNSVSDFYNACSVYCQPSVSEGFGLEVLEALAHGRPVIAAEGCGASELLPDDWVVPSANVDKLMERIDEFKRTSNYPPTEASVFARATAEKYTWDKIRARYVEVWKSLL